MGPEVVWWCRWMVKGSTRASTRGSLHKMFNSQVWHVVFYAWNQCLIFTAGQEYAGVFISFEMLDEFDHDRNRRDGKQPFMMVYFWGIIPNVSMTTAIFIYCRVFKAFVNSARFAVVSSNYVPPNIQNHPRSPGIRSGFGWPPPQDPRIVWTESPCCYAI